MGTTDPQRERVGRDDLDRARPLPPRSPENLGVAELGVIAVELGDPAAAS